MRADLIRQIFMTRKRSFICIAVLLAVNVVLYLVSTAYFEPSLASLQRSWAEKRRESSLSKVDPATVYRRGKADLAVWNGRIPPKKDFATFIGRLLEGAGDNTIEMGSISYKPGQVKGQKNLITYTITFSVSGKYAAIKSYVSDIQRMKDIVVIDGISLNGKSDEESVDMRIQLTVYFREESQ